MSELDWNTWGPPLAVLGAGVIVGLVVAFRSRGGSAQERAADAGQSEREALRARKTSLIEQIRVLDADMGKLDQAAFLAQREALVIEAAETLRQLDQLADTPAPAAPPQADDAAGDRRALRAGLWVSLVVVFFGILGVYLTESTKNRASGDSITGNTSATVAQQESEEVTAARAALAANPQDLEAINIITYNALTTRKLDEAMAMIDQARAIDAQSPDVLLHLAILQLSVGMFDKAEVALAQAVAAQPERGRHHLWMGLLRLYQNQPQAAVESIEKALSLGLRIDEQGFARQLLAEAKNPRPAAAAAPSGPTYSGPGGGAATVAGTVALAEGTAEDPAATVFVMVYASAEKGRPVATLRTSAGALPFSFAFEEGHAMGGAPWPDQVWVTAKIDADGAAGSGPDDVTIDLVGPLAKGAQGAVLQLPGRGAPAAAEAAAPEPAGPMLAGRVELGDGVAAAPDQTVFLIVYGSAAGAGRPVAARRLRVGDLPATFSLGAGDTMGGSPWPDQVWVKAKVDADGSAGSSEGDLDGPLIGPIEAGASGVVVRAGGS